MKANELRIGNYIQDRKGNEAIVEEISKDSFKAYSGCISYLPFEPILLTGDWLLKFGFYNDLDSWFYSLDFDKKMETFKIAPIYSNNNHSGMFKVLNCQSLIKKTQYVHQLQNLFFAFTGEELTDKSYEL